MIDMQEQNKGIPTGKVPTDATMNGKAPTTPAAPVENSSSSAVKPAPEKDAKIAPKKEIDYNNLPKTTGQKGYDWIQFWVGKVAILAATAALAYTARYGKDKYGPVPNYLKRFQNYFHDLLLHNKIFPMAQKGEFFKRLAGAGANTMILFHGGNAFAPIMLPLENNMENITNCINKRWGKPGEVEIAHEQLKDLPKQTWGDVIKGRLSAWGLIFISFLAADTLIGKTSKGMPRFDAYEEWFGRWMAGFTKSGKTLGINNVPVHVPLNPLQDANKIYRLGKILALDLYATTAGIFIWNGISRGSAKKRHLKQNGKEATNGNEVTAPVQAPDTITEPAVETPSEPIPSEEKDVCKTLVCKASKEKTPSNFTTKLPSPDEEFSKTRIKEKTLAAEAQVSISA